MSRIAILSDIHFGKDSRTSSFTVPKGEDFHKSKEVYPLEEGLIELLTKMHPQYFFVAGDLTSLGNPQEFYYCESKIVSIANRIGIDCKDIICVLGNHDVDWNISKLGDTVDNETKEVVALIREKYQMIAANCAKVNMDQLKLCYSDVGPAPFSGVIEKEDFVVFILNSSWCCTHNQQFPHGKLEQKQLRWFENTVNSYQADPRKKIILMHHHPFNYSYPIPEIDISTIEEGPQLMDIAAHNGVDIIVHGHRHHPRIETIQIKSGTKPITMICSGSLSVNHTQRNNGEIPNTIHFLDIDQSKDYHIVHNYKYTEASGWKLIEQYCKETPIDPVMVVGKIFSSDTIDETIKKYAICDRQRICWEDLEECLKFMLYKELNKRFIDILSPTHDIVGEFPKEVVLLKKEKKG